MNVSCVSIELHRGCFTLLFDAAPTFVMLLMIRDIDDPHLVPTYHVLVHCRYELLGRGQS